MTATATVFQPVSSGATRPILMAGLVAGAMDITAACIHAGSRGTGPVRVLHYVCSGLIGPAAFDGGAATAILGLLLHFTIATGAATVFHLASRKITFLLQHPIPSGIIYGPCVWCFMNFVVLPLSNLTRKPTFQLDSVVVIGLLIHMCCVGLPIALMNRKYSLR